MCWSWVSARTAGGHVGAVAGFVSPVETVMVTRWSEGGGLPDGGSDEITSPAGIVADYDNSAAICCPFSR